MKILWYSPFSCNLHHNTLLLFPFLVLLSIPTYFLIFALSLLLPFLLFAFSIPYMIQKIFFSFPSFHVSVTMYIYNFIRFFHSFSLVHLPPATQAPSLGTLQVHSPGPGVPRLVPRISYTNEQDSKTIIYYGSLLPLLPAKILAWSELKPLPYCPRLRLDQTKRVIRVNPQIYIPRAIQPSIQIHSFGLLSPKT